MRLSLIVAIGKNSEIGKNNGLLWHLSSDLKHFKAITTGHAVIMGRKTSLSLPNGALPNRTNVVLSRDRSLLLENFLVFPSLDAALVHLRDEEEVFIIGGGELYRRAFPIADKLYLTKVHAAFPDADAFFPHIDYSKWSMTARETVPASGKDAYDFTFYEYERK
jgi:dihydrofolate reductase